MGPRLSLEPGGLTVFRGGIETLSVRGMLKGYKRIIKNLKRE
ncbi:hypothetical protein SAMN05421761_102381 [Belliella pelovolcani]|uniref:Uncharacterized protein n=1 Tax=Belliella pelovolcani TaxID=529505 RepID=A0A1N7KVJ5_9BACT|nr:hypothetical protein SAMN05421761_102381 [Belliella pelovolcani]